MPLEELSKLNRNVDNKACLTARFRGSYLHPVSSNGQIKFIEVLISFFGSFFSKLKCVIRKATIFGIFFYVGNGTPDLLKYGICPYGLVVLMLIIITKATCASITTILSSVDQHLTINFASVVIDFVHALSHSRTVSRPSTTF